MNYKKAEQKFFRAFKVVLNVDDERAKKMAIQAVEVYKQEHRVNTRNHRPLLPNRIKVDALIKLLQYSDKYEISIQFWPSQIAVFIAKDGVDLIDFGGDGDHTIQNALDYLNRITTKSKKK